MSIVTLGLTHCKRCLKHLNMNEYMYCKQCKEKISKVANKYSISLKDGK